MADDWDNMRKQLEYETLRAEILGNIRQFFDIMVVMITISAALFGAGFQLKNGAIFLCEYIMLFFAVSKGKAIAFSTLSISAYLRVFHENDDLEGWESRVAKNKIIEWRRNSSSWKSIKLAQSDYQLLYCCLAIISSIAGARFLNGWQKYLWPGILLALWSYYNWHLSCKIAERYKSGDKKEIEKWRKIRDEEKNRESISP